jgi:hypothetical protein
MIPAPRTGSHDRLVIADGHTHAGQNAVIIQPARDGYLVRIGNDITKVAPQVVPADMLLIQTGDQR